jgi:inner membrane protein
VSSAAAHFLIGAALALPALRIAELTAILPRWRLPVTSGLLAAAPDLDLAGRRVFGIPAASLFAHRGFFHSPFFLILLAAALAGIVARRHSRKVFFWLWLIWAGCMVTHPLLDALSNGGSGVMLLLPFSRARLFFPWRPIYTPPGGVENIIWRAWLIRRSEIPFCIAAAAIGISGLLAIHPPDKTGKLRERGKW